MDTDLDEIWKELIVCILAVNQYSLEKAYGLSERLREQGLLSPANLAAFTVPEIAGKLRKSGYDRGAYLTHLIAERLAALGAFIGSTGVEECEALLKTKDKTSISRVLLGVHGIGPVVLRNFFSLRES